MAEIGSVISNDMKFEISQFDLIEELNGMIGVFKILCGDKKLKFRIKLISEEAFDKEIISDKKRIK